MLFDAQQVSELNTYVDAGADKELLRWWAQYAESNARFREALQYYERADDHLAIVRVLCFHKKFDRAAEVTPCCVSKTLYSRPGLVFRLHRECPRDLQVVEASGDLGAAYHLAKQYEAKDMIKQGAPA